MFQKIKTPIIIVALLFVGFFVYNQFIKKDGAEDTASVSVSSTVAPDKSILPLLLKVNSINFDSAFFSDPIFKSLKDYGKSIVSEESGRANPFAPSFTSGTSTLQGPTFDLQSAGGASTNPNNRFVTP